MRGSASEWAGNRVEPERFVNRLSRRPTGRDLSPQVFLDDVGGAASMAMSQRTPSHCPAIFEQFVDPRIVSGVRARG